MHCFLLCSAMAAVSAAAASGATISATPAVDHPAATIDVKGSKFAPKETVDIFFDGQEVQTSATDANGAFDAPKVVVPSKAQPGAHWITVVGRLNGDSSQTPFTVRTDWPQFQFSALRTGNNPYENTLSTDNVGNLVPSWGWTLISPTVWTFSSPAIANGVLYLGTDGGLSAYDPADGTPQWSYHTVGSILYSSPAVSDGWVYVGDVAGNLYSINALTGALRWQVSRVPSGAFNTPAAANGIVFETRVANAGGHAESWVTAFDAATGSWVWDTALSGQNTVATPPSIAGNLVYVGDYNSDSGNGTLHAFNAVSGMQVWSQPIPAALQTAPAVAGGAVYVSGYNTVYAFNATTGAPLWNSATISKVTCSPAVGNSTAYAVTDVTDGGSGAGYLYAFNAGTGAVKWVVPAAPPGTASQTCPIVADGVVYVPNYTRSPPPSEVGELDAFDASTGAFLWTSPWTGTVIGRPGSPVVANGMLYVRSTSGFNSFNLSSAPGRHHGLPPKPPAEKLLPDPKFLARTR